ncbi:MAG: RNA-binding protein [Armatimonadetes bacterium]|nr:RNA-binding protein [Armatimonadota bacterium]NIO71617.1 RNA-binding protein [Anaerolineae bacterium]NIM06496.1 RNA-binding protein [Armatimonadota bacterium]NIM24761.1 RNA-binding protein [Armatimonadota bacterium]NIM66777.1 RNA-binding protein [Armatimonadota bacterium]
MASKSIYVGNLPHGTTQDELRELFGQWDPTDVRLIADRGFGFVDVTEENVAEAISAVNGKDFKGRLLNVNEARPKRERFDRGGGGGGGRYGGGGGGGRRW